MKRDFLKNLGLTDEQVNSIMAENGKDIEKHKADLDKAKQESEKINTELQGVKTQLDDANKQIQDFKDMDIEGIKKSADDWKAKYDADTEALKKQMSMKEYDYSLDKYLSGHEFVSDFTKKAFIEEYKNKELKLENGKFLGGDDFIKEFKEANAGVFKEVKTESTPNGSNPPVYTYQPKGGQEGGQDLAAQALAAVMGNI